MRSSWIAALVLPLIVSAQESSTFRAGGGDQRPQARYPDDQYPAALEKGIVVEDSVAAGKTGELHVVVQDRATGSAGSIKIALDRTALDRR